MSLAGVRSGLITCHPEVPKDLDEILPLRKAQGQNDGC